MTVTMTVDEYDGASPRIKELWYEICSLRDLLSADDAVIRELRFQVDMLAHNYTEDEAKYKDEIEQLRAKLNSLTAEPYVIRISRREFMDLPIKTRRKIMARQVDEYLDATGGKYEVEE